MPEPRPCKNCESAERAPGRSLCWPCYVQHRAASTQSGAVPEGWAPAGASARYGAEGDFKGSSVRFAPPKATLDLRPAAPVTVNLTVNGLRPHKPTRVKVAMFLPDPQIGYRYDDDGVLDAFHDDDAMTWAVQQVALYQPDYVIHLGDLLDLAPFSRFAREPGFRGTTQPTLDRAHVFLASALAAAPDAKHVLIAGNHDVRIEREVSKLIPELASVRAPGSSHAALSVPSLLRLDDLGVEYVGGYPAGEYWVTPRLRAIHGDTVNSSGSTAAKIVERDAYACTVFGHVHRSEFHSTRARTGPSTTLVNWAASPGTLARVDGAVPSFHSGTDRGAAMYRPEDWVQGVGIARWTESNDQPRWEWVPR